MINRPETFDEENGRWEWRHDIREARQNLLVRLVHLVWLGIAAFCVVAALKALHQVL